jgi:hypothetical protein
MNWSFGTKLLIGFIVSYIILNISLQFILNTSSWKVRHMKILLRSLEPTNPDENSYQSLSPYSAEILKWSDNGRWMKEPIHRIHENMKLAWKIVDWLYWPYRVIINLFNKIEKFNDMWMNGTRRLYREIMHHLPI